MQSLLLLINFVININNFTANFNRGWSAWDTHFAGEVCQCPLCPHLLHHRTFQSVTEQEACAVLSPRACVWERAGDQGSFLSTREFRQGGSAAELPSLSSLNACSAVFFGKVTSPAAQQGLLPDSSPPALGLPSCLHPLFVSQASLTGASSWMDFVSPQCILRSKC